jgi:predicted nucleic-acid-binding protein
MIGIDSNVLVRYFAKDDPRQTPVAVRLMRSLSKRAPGYVLLVTLAELVWVMKRKYQATREQIGDILEVLLTAEELVVQDAVCAYRALGLYQRANIDYADALVAAGCKMAGCSRVVTFDKGAVGAGMELLGTS